MKLEGKTALVTGTSPNIMGGIAEELAREGANLVCADIRADYAEKCASAIVAEGHDAMGVGCDVTDEDQVVAAISQATERFGGVDILVNGAAVFNFKGVLNMPVDEWRRQTDIILTGAFLVHQARGSFDDPAESKGQHHQHHLHRGASGRAR